MPLSPPEEAHVGANEHRSGVGGSVYPQRWARFPGALLVIGSEVGKALLGWGMFSLISNLDPPLVKGHLVEEIGFADRTIYTH